MVNDVLCRNVILCPRPASSVTTQRMIDRAATRCDIISVANGRSQCLRRSRNRFRGWPRGFSLVTDRLKNDARYGTCLCLTVVVRRHSPTCCEGNLGPLDAAFFIVSWERRILGANLREKTWVQKAGSLNWIVKMLELWWCLCCKFLGTFDRSVCRQVTWLHGRFL